MEFGEGEGRRMERGRGGGWKEKTTQEDGVKFDPALTPQ